MGQSELRAAGPSGELHQVERGCQEPGRRPRAEAQSTRVLGIDFGTRCNQADRPTARLELFASRIVLAPLFRSQKVPRFCFGWLSFRTLGRLCATFWSKFRRALECPRQAAVPLLRLFDGHFTDCRFSAGQQAFSALWRAVSRGFLQQWRPAVCGRMETGPWQWHHPHGGTLCFRGRSDRERSRGLSLGDASS